MQRPLSGSLFPHAPCLPQHDGDPEGRSRQLEAERATYRYAYDKANIRGLAMNESLPPKDRPAPPWLAGLAQVYGRIAVNGAQLNGPPTPSVLAEIGAAIREGGLAAAVRHIQLDLALGGQRGPVSRLADYDDLFRQWPLSSEAREHELDSTFARLRVAGVNPAWIRRVEPSTGIPEDFAVTAAHYQAAVPSPDSLEAARKEGRLFLCEYRRLRDLAPGSVPVPPRLTVERAQDPTAWDAAYAAREQAYVNAGARKALCAPLALFAVPKGQRALVPVAIQLFPSGHAGQRHPVFTPRDGTDWTIAKACVQAADATVHETMSHLGATHLVQEAFCLAMHNCLSPRHPLHHLLAPHFEGTLSINASAEQDLVSAGGPVDQLLLPTAGGCIKLAAQAVQELDFNRDLFPEQLAARGVGDAEVLPDYPYRDDGRLVWGAIERWVSGYVRHYYPSDAEVGADAELQQFVRQLGQYKAPDAAGRLGGGGLRGVGEDGPAVRTRSYLIRMLTQIIWNGSAQHAAVNFPQSELMSHVKLYPIAMLGPVPSESSAPATEADYLRMMPHHESARMQLFILKLLGELHYTRLGHYSGGPLGGSSFAPAIAALEQAFQRDLSDVERTIEERNRTRTPYVHLLPSRIPQSINI